ncbi:hypothetical protein L1987_65931 [Smallanthus sonchifolius]|uniref:Uncharacterized protein n=1 Tax=Smallanthus sonchifolius TaxID=185202 RepID=A0ACB9BVW4_9ASTR|nr:hypothetical protein L1987_65931 [Smallanthus sonchifolius]
MMIINEATGSPLSSSPASRTLIGNTLVLNNLVKTKFYIYNFLSSAGRRNLNLLKPFNNIHLSDGLRRRRGDHSICSTQRSSFTVACVLSIAWQQG